ncbi:MAG: hypothetical protein IT204_22675 [Fimbriimonadaceae bacterium]|nr:hypothetical protein [Fimbriimonadaceae bacterium]
MRNAFAACLEELAAQDPRIVLLSGDIGNRLFDRFKERFPGRFYNCGVAEANMTGVAAGLAKAGLRPLTYTITPFNTTRCLEFIKLDICAHRLPVVVVGVGAGLSYAELGPTHHACDDLGLLGLLPDLTLLCPADARETRAALRAALAHAGPCYLRLGKKGEPDVFDAEPPFEIGALRPLRAGREVVLLTYGPLLPEVLAAGAALDATVVAVPTVKPLDTAGLAALAATGRLVTVEEHALRGGLGAAVAAWLAASGQPARLLTLGVPDQFLVTAGGQEAQRAACGIDTAGIVAQVRTWRQQLGDVT